MSLIYSLVREVSEGVLEDVAESWWLSHLSGVLTLDKNTKFMGKSKLIKILLIYVSSN